MTLARDVAKELEKRQRRRKLLFLGVVVTLIALAILYLRCGAGWGLGGGGKGKGEGGSATGAKDAGPKRCALRIDADGLTLDGKPTTQEAAVAACKAAGRADLFVVGNTREGDLESLRKALDDAGVPHGKP